MSKKENYEEIINKYIASLTKEEIEEKFAESARKEIGELIDSNKCIKITSPFSPIRSNIEDFTDRHLREFKDFVNWDKVSYEGRMTLDFMREFADKLNPHLILENKYILTKDKKAIMENYRKEISKENISWLEILT